MAVVEVLGPEVEHDELLRDGAVVARHAAHELGLTAWLVQRLTLTRALLRRRSCSTRRKHVNAHYTVYECNFTGKIMHWSTETENVATLWH